MKKRPLYGLRDSSLCDRRKWRPHRRVWQKLSVLNRQLKVDTLFAAQRSLTFSSSAIYIFFIFIALRSRNFTYQYIKHIFYLFQEGVPVLIVVIIGVVLLLLNVCACAAVIYQKHRVRQREDNLQRRIKRLSDAGLVMRPSNNDQTASTVSNNDLETTSR